MKYIRICCRKIILCILYYYIFFLHVFLYQKKFFFHLTRFFKTLERILNFSMSLMYFFTRFFLHDSFGTYLPCKKGVECI